MQRIIDGGGWPHFVHAQRRRNPREGKATGPMAFEEARKLGAALTEAADAQFEAAKQESGTGPA